MLRKRDKLFESHFIVCQCIQLVLGYKGYWQDERSYKDEEGKGQRAWWGEKLVKQLKWTDSLILDKLTKHFYRATLCIFAVAWCLSVTLVYCIQRAEDNVKPLSRPGSSMTLVFFGLRAPIPNSKGNPSARAQHTRDGKNLQFSTEIAVYFGNGTR